VPRYLSRWHCSSRPAAMFSIAADVRPFGSRVKPYEKHYRCHSEEPRDEESAFCFLLSAFCFLLSAFCFLLFPSHCPSNVGGKNPQFAPRPKSDPRLAASK